MDLRQFSTSEKTEKGAFIQLKHPVTGVSLKTEKDRPIGVTLMGPNAPAVKARSLELDREWAALVKDKPDGEKKKDADRLTYEGRERLIAATVGFTNVTVDKKILNGPDDARLFFDDAGFDAFHAQLLTAMYQIANFMKGDDKA